MLETQATVTHIENQTIYVKPLTNRSCQHCQGKGCGTYAIARLFCKQDESYRVENPHSLSVSIGQHVTLVLPEGTLLKTAVIAYVIPLLFLLGGTFLGKMWTHQEGGALFGALLGFGIGLGIFWFLSRKKPLIPLPYIIK